MSEKFKLSTQQAELLKQFCTVCEIVPLLIFTVCKTQPVRVVGSRSWIL